MKEINQGASVETATKPHLRARRVTHPWAVSQPPGGAEGSTGPRPPLPSIVGDGATIAQVRDLSPGVSTWKTHFYSAKPSNPCSAAALLPLFIYFSLILNCVCLRAQGVMALCSEACVAAPAAGGESSGSEVSFSSPLHSHFSLLAVVWHPGGKDPAARLLFRRYFTA